MSVTFSRQFLPAPRRDQGERPPVRPSQRGAAWFGRRRHTGRRRVRRFPCCRSGWLARAVVRPARLAQSGWTPFVPVKRPSAATKGRRRTRSIAQHLLLALPLRRAYLLRIRRDHRAASPARPRGAASPPSPARAAAPVRVLAAFGRQKIGEGCGLLMSRNVCTFVNCGFYIGASHRDGKMYS